MEFVSTFFWSFCFWQFFSLAPFTLTNNTSRPYKNNKLIIFASFSLLFHIALAICSLTFTDWYIDWKNQTTILAYYNIYAYMLLHQVTSCIIVIEALVNINHQIDFVQRMNKIDNALRHKMQIKINYEKCQLQNNVGFIVWLLWHLISQTAIFAFENEIENRFQLLYVVSFILYSLQFQRCVLYVYQIHHRYELLNLFILETFPLDDNIDEIQEVNIDYDRNNHLKAQIFNLSDIYQELQDASDAINKIFRWSLPLCIGNDFQGILGEIYWMLVLLLSDNNHNPWTIYVSRFFWLSWHLLHILFLSHACHSTSREVSITIFISSNFEIVN